MAEPKSSSTNTADREIVITRIFDAPRELVMTLRHVGLPPEMGEMAEAGWNESIDKLAETLEKEKSI
jgi:uncharacterized protein YndB with AHSA1/START domain